MNSNLWIEIPLRLDANPQEPMAYAQEPPLATYTSPSVPFQPELNGSSLRIKFMHNQNHCQIGPLCIDERSDRIENLVAIARLSDPPASM